MQKQVENGETPKGVDRVDKPHVPGMQPHVHFDDGTAINQDGTTSHKKNGDPNLTNKIKQWLQDNGWGIGE